MARIEKLIKQKVKIRPVPRIENGKRIEADIADRPVKKHKKPTKKQQKPKAEAYQEDSSKPSIRPSLFK